LQSDTYKIVYSKVIFRAIKDMVSGRAENRQDAIKYLKSEAFLQHCRVAGFPCELQDALDEMLLLSNTQQKLVAEMFLEELAG